MGKWRYYWPLAGFVIPTVGIGYGWVIPQSMIAGINDLTIGFAASIIGAVVTYVIGVRVVLRDIDGKTDKTGKPDLPPHR